VLILTGCSEFKPYRTTGVAPVVVRGYGADYWLEELHQTRQLPPDQLQNMADAWELEMRSEPSTSNRIRLALLLTAGGEAVRDPVRARDLLDGIEAPPKVASERELLALLRQILDEQEQARTAAKKLKKQIRSQDRRIRELEEQQRALTNIEQNIQLRDIQTDVENDGR
jgi:hypothetical protein